MKAPFSGLALLKQESTKDIYRAGDNLLIVATDRVLSRDASGSRLILGVGQITKQLSTYWFQKLAKHFPNHFISADVEDFPAPCDSMGSLP